MKEQGEVFGEGVAVEEEVGGAVHIVFVDDEHLAQVVGLACLAQYLALQVAQRGKVPASAAAVLVLLVGKVTN